MNDWIRPGWKAPANVRAFQTTRTGGVSLGPWSSLNLGDHCGDDPAAVAANRRLLQAALPSGPRWLRQVHGTAVVDVDTWTQAEKPEADGALTRSPGTVCTVLTADCLPVLLCDDAGTVVAAVHAGWRGLLAGVIEKGVEAMGVPPASLMAWLGAAIGPGRFEVGEEVRAAYVAEDPAAAAAFAPAAPGKYLADLYALGRQRLARAGVARCTGGDLCTHSDPGRFFSHRRDGRGGRMATLVWLA